VASNSPWLPLEIHFAEAEDLERLSREEQSEVERVLELFAKTGCGADTILRAPGALPYELLRAGRLEIEVEVHRGDEGATSVLLVCGIYVAPDESDTD